MFEGKFIDGTPVPAAYQQRITKMVDDACRAEKLWDSLDELEFEVGQERRHEAKEH
jgi:hypothetical protein